MPKFSETIIIFDWGNTLVLDPFQAVLPEVVKKTATLAKEKFGITLDTQAFSNFWSKSNSELDFPNASHFFQEEPFIQQGLKGASVPVEICPLLAPMILSEYRMKFKEVLEKQAKRTIQVNETLIKLREAGKKLGVLSNDRSFTPRATLKWLKLSDLFELIITSEDMGLAKPDPRVFDIISEKFIKPLTDIIYIGDDPVKDIQCAHAAGIKAILHIPPDRDRLSKNWRNYSISTDQPDATITNFPELLDLFS